MKMHRRKSEGRKLTIGALLLGTVFALQAPAFAGEPPKAAMRVAQATETASPNTDEATAEGVSLYLWSASKAVDGAITLEGNVPSDETRQTLRDSIGGSIVDSMQVAPGQPADFAANAVAALDILGNLDSGRVAYDGSLWSVSGKVDSADKAKAARASFDASPLKALGASYVVEEPSAAAAPPAAPAVSPNYAWSAEKAGDGTITLNGSVPTTALKDALAGQAGAKIVDDSVIATGAPDEFVDEAPQGLEALKALQSGKLLFAAGEWSLAGLAANDTAEQAAHDALKTVDTGKWRFDIRTPAAPPAADTAASPQSAEAAPAAEPAAAPPATASAPAPYVFRATKADNGTTTMAGDLPTAGARGYLADAVGKADTSNVQIVPDAPDGFIAGAMAGLPALAELSAGELDFDGNSWSLKGRAATPEVQKSVEAQIAALPDAGQWKVAIEGPSSLDLCQTGLANFSASNSIVFDARTRLAPGAAAQLDALAKVLAACPDAKVYIEGHTDSDGDAKSNLALSVARAEAVTAQLVTRGIASNRLYAVGYGETVPLVPNTTKANKARNRRIEIKLAEPSIPN